MAEGWKVTQPNLTKVWRGCTRYVLEGSADQQRQREELGKIALSPPPGRGMAGVAADLGVNLGRLSQQGGGK
eukprot:1140191-Pelagomonas_calceolata.AAC.1